MHFLFLRSSLLGEYNFLWKGKFNQVFMIVKINDG